MGNGFYADKLSYAQWFDFNNSVRSNLNFVESMPILMVYILIGGLVFPQVSMYIGFVNCVSRPVYIYGYKAKGGNGRIAGAVFGQLPVYLLGLASLGTLIHRIATSA